MSDSTPSIPILLSLAPFTVPIGQPIGDQTLRRGGLFQVGTADPAAGGGPVYVAILSGAAVKFDPETGVGTPGQIPPAYDATYYIRFDGARAATQPKFDWLKPNDDKNSAGFLYSCIRTDQ